MEAPGRRVLPHEPLADERAQDLGEAGLAVSECGGESAQRHPLGMAHERLEHTHRPGHRGHADAGTVDEVWHRIGNQVSYLAPGPRLFTTAVRPAAVGREW